MLCLSIRLFKTKVQTILEILQLLKLFLKKLDECTIMDGMLLRRVTFHLIVSLSFIIVLLI